LSTQIVVRDPKMIAVLESARKVAPYKAAVLITGETGTGKELIARIIHQHSSRCAKPWVDLNCAALPEHLVESELFGYEKGAFSGADSTKPGLFESANGGTIFLDEIGDLEPKVQVKLLRVLDGTPYYRLGGCKKVLVDVRVITATNRDLEAAVRAGTFRRDLFHRISEVHIHIPPLRDRPQDIAALAEHFLACNHPSARFTPGALERLLRMDWRGNVRELRNLVLRVGILAPHDDVGAEDILRITSDDETCVPQTLAEIEDNIIPMYEMERAMILRALETTGGNQSLAALRLGIPRRTFCRKLNAYRITFGRRSCNTSARVTAPLPADYRAELNVTLVVQSRDGSCFMAETRNLSVGGLGVQNFPSPVDCSQELVLQFKLPNVDRLILAKGVVAWSQPNATAGIRFTEINPATSELLRNWIANSRPTWVGNTPELQEIDELQTAETQLVMA
jgi:transcriptional regulator with AAA-type ATPase domain